MARYGKRAEIDLAIMQRQEKERIKNMTEDEFRSHFMSFSGLDVSNESDEILIHRLALFNCVTLTQSSLIDDLSLGWLSPKHEVEKLNSLWLACGGVFSSSQSDGTFVMEPFFESEKPVLALAGWLLLRRFDESLPD